MCCSEMNAMKLGETAIVRLISLIRILPGDSWSLFVLSFYNPFSFASVAML